MGLKSVTTLKCRMARFANISPNSDCLNILKVSVNELGLSAHDKLLPLALTIEYLASADTIDAGALKKA